MSNAEGLHPGLAVPDDKLGHDNINHPAHYTAFPGVEVIDITKHLNFCRGSATKYLCRAGLKDPSKELEDLRKALWYVQCEIDRVEEAQNHAELG